MATPKQRYLDLVQDGTLRADDAQSLAMDQLQIVADELAMYKPTPKRSGLFGMFGKKQKPTPLGLYMWGGVGRGKSLLMDMFFNNMPIIHKRRVHFHEFMVETHERIHAWRQMDETTRRRQSHYDPDADIDDPIPHVAKAAFDQAWLFCFDEMQVTDIADAMLLGRLFESLFDRGAVVIATSNRHPDDLYKDGLNRQLFLPFIEKFKTRCMVHELKSPIDYRMEQLMAAPVFYNPLGAAADQAMDQAWQNIIVGGSEIAETHMIKGRALTAKRATRGAARFTFDELCAAALGAEDYLCLAIAYHTIFMDQIPILSPENRNEAKRFVTFIDALYEQSTKFVCSAAASPDQLYPSGHGSFEFERTTSRLIEMQSINYMKKAHTAL